MPSFKKLVAFALSPTLLLLMSCGRHSQSEVYYLVAANIELALLEDCSLRLQCGCGAYKVTAKVAGPDNYDPQAELQELNHAVAAKPAGILISVADEALLKPGIDAAVDAGIPVITMDSDAPTSRRLYFIGTNNVAAGHLGRAACRGKAGRPGQCGFLLDARTAQSG
jgi:ribose transport system substrate-binding protein